MTAADLKKIKIIFFIEVLICALIIIMGILTDNSIPEGDLTQTLMNEGIPLNAGIYEARLYYEADSDKTDVFSLDAEDSLFHTLRSNTVTVFADENESVCRFYLNGKVENIRVCITEDDDFNIAVRKIEIYSVSNGCGAVLFTAICLFILINLYIMIYLYHKSKGFDKLSQAVIAILTVACVCSSLPLMVDYVYNSYEIGAVLASVENIKLSPQMIFHGKSAVLLFPAFLDRIGISLGASYRFLLVFINIFTILSAYGCLKTALGNRVAALCGSVLYALNFYRIDILYKHAFPDMAAAMIFLPLLSVGVMKLLFRDRHISLRMAGICTLAGIMGMLPCIQGCGVKERVVLVLILSITVLYEIIFRYVSRMGYTAAAQNVMAAAMLLVLLAGAFKADSVVKNQLPLWVYSPSDIVEADSRGMAGLVLSTYGIK
jgi:hypothetical protein